MTEQELYDYAISMLAKKNYSSGDMHRQLARVTEKMDDVEHVLRRLTENHYLNDIQSINYLIDKQIKKFHGPTRIKQELRQKGFPPALIEQEIEQSDVDWYELAKEARVRKFGDALPTEPKEKNKQIRHLQYKGYTMDTIFEALS
ncbi:regulatory protein RecX [Mixta mediterraneensis]|uniref:regulatory protein RecX n=1 Tax=Mixta mediterraneensis TaxID=2758443 RepID=UPI0018738363|nr:regulatory protein RecX [Mixta mediterraneensis]MBE5254401.1 regulatory protein RecX [Mixta mediterraneensis]